MGITTGTGILKVKAFTILAFLGTLFFLPLNNLNKTHSVTYNDYEGQTYCVVIPENSHVLELPEVWECDSGYEKLENICVKSKNVVGAVNGADVEGIKDFKPTVPTYISAALFILGTAAGAWYLSRKRRDEGTWA